MSLYVVTARKTYNWEGMCPHPTRRGGDTRFRHEDGNTPAADDYVT